MLIEDNYSNCEPRGSSSPRFLNQSQICGVLSVTLLDHLPSHALHDSAHLSALNFAVDLWAVGLMKFVLEGAERKDLLLTPVEGLFIGFRESSSRDR